MQMKTTFTIRIGICIIVAIALSVAACKKGDTGPVGPEGPQGEKGNAGEKGDAGNANVISTGWLTLTSDKWRKSGGAGSAIYTEPGDIGTPWATSGFYNLNSQRDDPGKSVILVYVDDGRGAKLLNTNKWVTGGGKSGTVELRFLFDTNLAYALWLEVMVVLKTGTWDDNYVQNTFLPSLKWRVVVIPPSAATATKKLDFTDFETTKKALSLSN